MKRAKHYSGLLIAQLRLKSISHFESRAGGRNDSACWTVMANEFKCNRLSWCIKNFYYKCYDFPFQVVGAIVEVGIGGRYDHTNVIEYVLLFGSNNPSLFSEPTVTVVTEIHLEHTEILGDTIESIAWNKAGIFKVSLFQPYLC